MNNQPTHQISDDELLLQSVEQLGIIANQAILLAELCKKGTDENLCTKDIEDCELLAENIIKNTKGFNIVPILSRLVVNIAAANQSKHILGARLSVNKKDKSIHIKGHYGPGVNDYNDLNIDIETAKQLRDGLIKACDMIDPQPKIIMPGSGIVM